MALLETHIFNGSESGPDFLILGAVHGNEPCGTRAIEQVLALIEKGQISFIKGCVTFIPVCNPKAYKQNIRYVESNLNRNLYPKEQPKTYEDYLGNELCGYLQQADLLLDIHSYRRGGPAFGFISPKQTEEELKLIETANVPYAVYGFAEAYENANIAVNEKEAMGTREYLLTCGGQGITLECGQHNDPESINVAFHAIINTLKDFGLIDVKADLSSPQECASAKIIRMKHVIFKEYDGQLTQPYENFAPVKKGDKLATYDNKTEVFAPCDGIVVLPDPRSDMPVGEEWLYLGTDE